MVIIYDIWGQLPKYFEPGAQHEGRPAAEDLEGGQGDRQGGVTDCQVEKETGEVEVFFSITSLTLTPMHHHHFLHHRFPPHHQNRHRQNQHLQNWHHHHDQIGIMI